MLYSWERHAKSWRRRPDCRWRRLLSLKKAYEYASLDNIDKQNYVKAMTTARDTHNQIEYAKEITREEERKAIAINLIQLGTPCEIVAKATGLSLEEVAKLKEEVKLHV